MDDIYFEMFSKTGCHSCDQAKLWLTSRGFPFTAKVLDTQDERDALYDRLNLKGAKRCVPQIFTVDQTDGSKTRIGGYDDLVVSGLG